MRNFVEDDLNKIDLNDFSCDALKYLDVFLSDTFTKFSLERDGKVWCIIAFRENEPNKFLALMMFDKKIPSIYARKIKSFMQEKIKEAKPDLVETWSVDCNFINRWHEFLGLQKKEHIVYDGKELNRWCISWE